MFSAKRRSIFSGTLRCLNTSIFILKYIRPDGEMGPYIFEFRTEPTNFSFE